MINRRRLVLVGAVVALLVPSTVQARIKVRLRGVGLPGRGSYGPGVLKLDELEQCVKSEKDINVGSDSLDKTEIALKARTDEIERLDQEIDRSAAQMDRTSQVAINNHNAKVQRHQALVRDYNMQIASFNSRADNHNAQIGQFNSNCANKKYYESDMQTVRSRVGP
jgi:hypothetical protein